MIGLIGRLNAKLGDLSPAARCAILLSTVVGVFAVATPVAYGRHGTLGLQAVAIAAVVCGVCSLAALVLATLWHGTPNGVAGALGGSLVGMFPPLAVGLALQHNNMPVAAAGAFGWIVVFYLTTLVVKTLLVAPAMSKSPRGVAASAAAVSSNASTQAGT